MRSLRRKTLEEFEADLDEPLDEDTAPNPAGPPFTPPAPGGEHGTAASRGPSAAAAGRGMGGLPGPASPPNGSSPPQQDDPAALRERAALVRASAWYYVTYHPDCQREALGAGGAQARGVRLFSFAWLVASRLAQIKWDRGGSPEP